MKIATTSICKNELKYIDKWYEALKDEVDYITVLDTGSTDGTFEKLQELSKSDPKVIVIQEKVVPWRFDTARNRALELLPKDTDVFISIDMDERFESGFGEIIRNNWTKETVQGSYRYTWSHNADGSPAHEFTYSKIVKNDGKWKWKYPVHECLIRVDDKKEYPASSLIDFGDKIHLHHYQDGVFRTNYLELLKIRAEENNDDIDYLYLGREYTFHQRWWDSIDTFMKIVYKKDKSTLKVYEQAYLRYMIGCSYLQLSDETSAVKWIKESIEVDNNFRDPYIQLAKLSISKGDNAQAKWYIKSALENTTRKWVWTEVGDVWSYVVYDLLSVASFNSGDKVTALAAVTKALDLNKGNKLLEANRNKILASITDKDFK